MAWYSGAHKRPISVNYTNRRTDKNAVVLHTTASASAKSMYGWFSNRSARASSHFHVDVDGRVEQYVDTAKIAWADKEAIYRSVSIETQGDGTAPWTSKQIDALVDLVAWITKTHAIPVRRMRSSSSSEKGIGWHRLGVNGNFPDGLLGGRRQNGGGQTWSGAYGKTCPGTDRIKQIPDLIDQVKGGGKKNAASSGGGSKGKGKSSKPGSPGEGPWPEAYLTVKDEHNKWSHKAWVKLLTDVGHTNADDDLTRAMQNWLRKLGYYDGYIDSQFGPLTTKALQSFLKDKGLYRGRIDGDRGPMTITAEFKYLNDQAELY